VINIHVCFVGQEIHPPWIRGDPQLFKEMINALVGNDDIEISLITTHDVTGDNESNAAQFEAFARGLKNVIVLRGTGNHNYAPRSYDVNSLLLWRAASGLASREAVDIFHIGSLNASLFAPLMRLKIPRLRNVKLVRHIYMLLQQRRGRFAVPLLRATYAHFFDGVAVTSGNIRAELHRRGIADDVIFFVPPIINTDFFTPHSTQRQPGPIRVLYMGSVSQKRFPLDVLSSIHTLRQEGLNLQLSIVARYEFERVWIDKIASQALKLGLGDSVMTRVQALEEREKRDLYNTADIVLLPFSGPVGATQPPLVLLEAMSCGKVVVATREQDIPLIVEHGFNGLLVDDLNPEDLADALRLAASSERAAFIAANARETIVNSFSREVGRERLLQMYTSILNR